MFFSSLFYDVAYITHTINLTMKFIQSITLKLIFIIFFYRGGGGNSCVTSMNLLSHTHLQYKSFTCDTSIHTHMMCRVHVSYVFENKFN